MWGACIWMITGSVLLHPSVAQDAIEWPSSIVLATRHYRIVLIMRNIEQVSTFDLSHHPSFLIRNKAIRSKRRPLAI